MTNFIPIFPLGLVVYPGESLNLHIFEPRYKQLIQECHAAKKPFGIPTVINNKLQEFGALVEIAELESLPAAMARLDRNFDNLKLCRTAGWKAPADHPDLNPVIEALLVQEVLHECCRHLEADRDPQLREWLEQSDDIAGALHRALTEQDFSAADPLLSSLGEKCVQCHVAFRNH